MGTADLHIHTNFSKDGLYPVFEVVSYAATKTDLDVIAITDHDVIEGSLIAKEFAAQFDIEVVTGCEISTAEGHLLGLFIDKSIPAGLSVYESVILVGELGGLCIVPHPTGPRSIDMKAETIREALKIPEVRKTLIGIETFNANEHNYRSNKKAQELANQISIATVGNSDAHKIRHIGFGMTGFPGKTAADLRKALEMHATVVYQQIEIQLPAFVGEW
jgi:predicted metal-dependent phosphoesterase TrpH